MGEKIITSDATLKIYFCLQNIEQSIIEELENSLNIKSLGLCTKFNCFVTDCLNIAWELAKYSKLVLFITKL